MDSGAGAGHPPPLALGIDGIKGKAGFAGTAEAGKDHHLISGDGQVYIFQIVFPGTPDNDFIVHSYLAPGPSAQSFLKIS